MKKNGFLSVSTVFAFFLVFLSLMLYIILSMSNNRFLLDKMKTTIKNELIEGEPEDKIDGNDEDEKNDDDDTKEETFADWVKSQYTGTQGENNLYYHDSTLENGAGDNSYRYAGAHDEVNNFVCFGTDDESCPDDNLYRIIGVFGDQVKLIKWDYANSDLLGTDGDYSSNTYLKSDYSERYKGLMETVNRYYWSSIGTNIWSTSKLNITNLNTNFINNIETAWLNKIATTDWIVGGSVYNNILRATPQNVYNSEIISPANSTTYSAKIGLMYTSDYGFAASPSAWTTTLISYDDVTDINWIYMGMQEWTITRNAYYSNDRAYYIRHSGLVHGQYDADTVNGYTSCIRPVFYLNSNVMRISGSGSKTDPIRLG